MKPSVNTPADTPADAPTQAPASAGWLALLAVAGLLGAPLGAQAPANAPLLDALSITVRLDSTTVARGSARYRQVRTGPELELVASGIVVQRGLRVTSELHTDSAYVLHRYLAESRDSAGTVIDRILVTSAGGRITFERTTPRRRIMREFASDRDLMILDSAAVVPFVVLAGVGMRAATIPLLDVRSGQVRIATLTPGASIDLSLAEVLVPGMPIAVSGLSSPLRWWRDVKGRLLRVAWGERSGVLRDDPPT